jgi:glycosyltransferase involved in cell wall biosynthesis
MRLTAVVPATNDPPTLAACRAAIDAAADPPDEVLIVRDPPRSGPAAARNAGALQATGDAIVFVDSDVAIHGDAFTRVRDAFFEHPELTAVIGSYDDEPADPALVSRFRNLLHHHVHQEAAGPVASFWGGIGAIRRDAFLAAGGFDTNRYSGPSIEDVELGMRLADGGAAIVLDPRLQGKHLKRWTLREMLVTDVMHRGAPWVELLLRRRRLPTELNLSWRHRVGAGAWLVAGAGLAARRPLVAGTALALAAGANQPFYALLHRRLGARGAAAGIALHGLHYLSAAASVPVGAAVYARRLRDQAAA